MRKKHEWSKWKTSEKRGAGTDDVFMKVCVDKGPQIDYILVHDLRWDFEGWG